MYDIQGTQFSLKDPVESLGWLAESSLEQEDVWLGLVDHVVDPAWALLDTQGPPLGLRHQLVFRNQLDQILGTKKRSGGLCT